jgi:ribosome-associated translation inhibitor RaiA
MFEAIDVAIDRLDALLARDKDRRKHHKGAPSSDLAASGLAGPARPFGPATEL